MTPADFNSLLEVILGRIKDTLESRAEYYASQDNRLHNFYRAARIDEISPIQALRGMQLKHRTAIADFIEKPHINDTPLTEWEEKIIDTINYYILLLAMIQDHHKGSKGV